MGVGGYRYLQQALAEIDSQDKSKGFQRRDRDLEIEIRSALGGVRAKLGERQPALETLNAALERARESGLRSRN